MNKLAAASTGVDEERRDVGTGCARVSGSSRLVVAETIAAAAVLLSYPDGAQLTPVGGSRAGHGVVRAESTSVTSGHSKLKFG